MKITVAMIVKNEANHIRTALESVRSADEIVVCDTGSDDLTVHIAKEYTDRVYTDYQWEDSFCKARNHSLSKVDDGSWVITLDADEVLETPMEEVRKAVADADAKGFKTISTKVVSKRDGQIHRFSRIFKKCPEVFWKGDIHNYLSLAEQNEQDITIRYGYSDAHLRDPDRTIRILKKVVSEQPECVREKYYLAREYYYRKDYKLAIHWYEQYLKVSWWHPEKADALLMLARCHWYSSQGSKARYYCFEAVKLNPDFKEALLLLGDMHHSPWKEKWHKLATAATNEDVLFIRKR